MNRYDPVTGMYVPSPFNLTPRRREVLYWIAYGPAHGVELRHQHIRPFWRGYAGGDVVKLTLHGTDVTEIVKLLRQHRLIKRCSWLSGFEFWGFYVTPAGMARLLEPVQC